MASSKAATYLAFNSVVKRSLVTLTPIRPRPHLPVLPPHHSLTTRGRKLPKNHFTSHHPRRVDDIQQDGIKQNSQKDRGPKRKASQRTLQAPSLRRVAVEAQNQRSQASFIKGRGKSRHVDPEAETKDVTAYCAAETYNIHIARDVLIKEGWEVDPLKNGLFPQVLHLRTPSRMGVDDDASASDVLVFPSGTVVTWSVPERLARLLVDRLLLPAATNSHPEKLEAEDLEYLQDPSRESNEIIGDTIILGTKADNTHPSHDSSHEIDTLLAKIAFSSALARSTKLAVLENTLSAYFQTISSIPLLLSTGKKPRFTRAFILRKTGELLSIRAQLNLYSELTDSLPDLFWDSPHELGLGDIYEQVGRNLDVGVRIKVLNEKMDYAAEIAAVLRERLSEGHSHLLEWIIIWLILIEVAYGSLHLWRERQERLNPSSTQNLLREYLNKQLGKI